MLQGFVKAIAVHVGLNDPEIEIRLNLAECLKTYPTPEEIDLVYDEEQLQTVYDIFDYSLKECLQKVELLRNARDPKSKQKGLPILGLGFKGPRFEEEPTSRENTVFLNFTSAMRSTTQGVIGTPLLFAMQYYFKKEKAYDFNIEVLDNPSSESLRAYDHITHKVIDLCTSGGFIPHPFFSKMFAEAIMGRVKSKLATLEEQNEIDEKGEELCQSILKQFSNVLGTLNSSQNSLPKTKSVPPVNLIGEAEAASKLPTSLNLIPLYEKNVGKFTEKEIADYLWMGPEGPISEFVPKVNTVAVYLWKQGFQLRGVKADGNCFCNAFLKSSEHLSNKLHMLDGEDNQISYLRRHIANQYKAIHGETGAVRVQQIERDREWLCAHNEGDLLAKALNIPIRIVTVTQEGGINDMLTFPEKNKETQEWNGFDEKPKDYILIVDLGGHFIYAQENEKVEESSCNSPDTRFLTYQQDLPLFNTEQKEFVHKTSMKEKEGSASNRLLTWQLEMAFHFHLLWGETLEIRSRLKASRMLLERVISFNHALHDVKSSALLIDYGQS